MFLLMSLRRLRDVIVSKGSNSFGGGPEFELENLPNIQRMLLTSNYLNGEIPSTVDIAPPKELTVMRISDFSGLETHKIVFEAMMKYLLRGFHEWDLEIFGSHENNLEVCVVKECYSTGKHQHNSTRTKLSSAKLKGANLQRVLLRHVNLRVEQYA